MEIRHKVTNATSSISNFLSFLLFFLYFLALDLIILISLGFIFFCTEALFKCYGDAVVPVAAQNVNYYTRKLDIFRYSSFSFCDNYLIYGIGCVTWHRMDDKGLFSTPFMFYRYLI